MSEELLIRRIRAALDVAPVDPALRRRVIASLPLDRRQARARYNFWAPALAIALAVAVVLGLVWANPWRSFPASHPATVPLSECELPIYGFAPYQAGAPNVYDVGFLDLATKTFTPAPMSIASADQTRAVLGNEFPAISYDRAAGAWVPAKASRVAPDGMSYVYPVGNDIHLRSVRTQSDRVFQTKRDAAASSYPSTEAFLIGWSGELIYYAVRYGTGSDLWTLDPTTGTQSEVLRIQAGSEWWYAGPNAIWGSAYYTGKIARYDTNTRVVSSWSLDGLVDMVGIDSAGSPIVLVGDRGAETGRLAIMRTNGTSTPVGASSNVFQSGTLAVVADADRIWISASGQRLWVYSPDTGLLFLDQSSNSALPNGLVVAGGCVSKAEVPAHSAAGG
jgi:hypothetical protein